MSILTIDYIHDTPSQIVSKFKQIQKRYFDPYSIRLLTDSNQYVYLEKKFNEYTKILYGNNKRLYGLKAQIEEIDPHQGRAVITISEGALISDGVVIKFTQPFKLIQSTNNLSLDSNTYNLVFVEYQFVETYPPNIAKINFLSKTKIEQNLSPNLFKGVLYAFKFNQNGELIESIPDINCDSNSPENCVPTDKDYFEIFSNKYQISPPYDYKYFEQGIYKVIDNLKQTLGALEIDIYSHLLKHEEKINVFSKLSENFFKLNDFEKSITINQKTAAPLTINLTTKFPELNQINREYFKNAIIDVYLNGIKLHSNIHYKFDKDNLTLTLYYPKIFLQNDTIIIKFGYNVL